MAILLTYTSALEAMRLEEFPDLLDAWDERTAHVPERLPSKGELLGMIEANPLLQKLSLPLHLLVSSDSNSHSYDLVQRHVSGFAYPRRAFARIGEDVYVASPELLPFQMARVGEPLELALLMCELCGTYSVCPDGDGMLQRTGPLTTRESLRDFLRLMGTGYGTRRVRAALPLVCADSGSPYESRLGMRFRGRREVGGFELEFVSMNEEIGLEAIGRELDRKQIRKPDILFLAPPRVERAERMPFRGIAVDYKGRVHDEPAVAEVDDTRRNELLAHGIKPYELRKAHYDDLDYMESFVQKLRRDLGLPPDDFSYGRELREDLYQDLERIDTVHWSGQDPVRRPLRTRLP